MYTAILCYALGVKFSRLAKGTSFQMCVSPGVCVFIQSPAFTAVGQPTHGS